VTVEEFLRFRKEHKYAVATTPTPDCPMNSVSWYEAAEYCNWLSEREGLPQDQWCYRQNEAGKYDEGMTVAPDWQRLTGYRLPTEVEWEFACRAGARTDWPCGEADAELVSQYAWWYGNSQANGVSQMSPVGMLKPNDWGLFDMLGNVSEWCHNRADRQDENGTPAPAGGPASNTVNRAIRGSAFVRPVKDMVATFRLASEPGYGPSAVGLRPVRTTR
jgi:formylglycine-generating enzyme required for sulfatase activity